MPNLEPGVRSAPRMPARRRILRTRHRPSRKRHRILTRFAWTIGTAALLLAVTAGWLATRAHQISTELRAAEALIPEFTTQILEHDSSNASTTIDQIVSHTAAAREAANDPIWNLAGAVPILGSNFSAIREVAVAASEVAHGTAKPLLRVVGALNWEALTPVDGKLSLEPLETSSPTIVSAATTVELTHSRLQAIDKRNLVSEVATPLAETTAKLDALRSGLRAAADVSKVLPAMMGTNEARNYLVLIQNNAEVRATGGLPGSLALVRVDDGFIELVNQISGSDMGRFTPPVEVEKVQTQIYSTRLGTFISDVNLTPDFPTTARTAKAMWEHRYGGSIDGVLAIDPIVLKHILEASGPIPLPDSQSLATSKGLPAALTANNVVKTILSDVYLNLDTNEAQDAYFAGASEEIFNSLASGKASGPAMLRALGKSYEEDRLHLWSDHQNDQKILSTTGLGGAVSGPYVGGAAFGVYFNDGTGAKMDYYVRRSVQLIEVCTNNEYAEFKVRVTLTNTAPADAATSLPAAVTGGGVFGVPAGTVQTNVVVYGPSQSYVDTAVRDGASDTFGSHSHSGRPVGTLTTRLSPGQRTEIEMTFVKVVQRTDPTLTVTPTVQDVKDVTLPTEYNQCN